MNKIPTVFTRDPDDMSRVTEDVHPGAQWVIDGEGTATRKYDGTCMMLDANKKWWSRREVKPNKPDPEGFMSIDEDEATGKRVGWVPMSPQGFLHPLVDALGLSETLAKNEPKDFMDLITKYTHLEPGTYELLGPKINGNPEGFGHHVLVKHAQAEILDVNNMVAGYKPVTRADFKALMEYISTLGWEGLVWHHPDGRMAKLKVKDFRNG